MVHGDHDAGTATTSYTVRRRRGHLSVSGRIRLIRTSPPSRGTMTAPSRCITVTQWSEHRRPVRSGWLPRVCQPSTVPSSTAGARLMVQAGLEPQRWRFLTGERHGSRQSRNAIVERSPGPPVASMALAMRLTFVLRRIRWPARSERVARRPWKATGRTLVSARRGRQAAHLRRLIAAGAHVEGAVSHRVFPSRLLRMCLVASQFNFI